MVKQENIHRREHYTSRHRVTGQGNLMSSETMGSAPVLGDGTNTHSRGQMKMEEEKKEGECRLQIAVTDMFLSNLSANYCG